VVDDEKKKEIEKELGDVLWYVSQLSSELGLSLKEVAEKNIEKLYSRMDRGKLKGDGDNR
jgi:NTP pyrophosphatase (non-canonical NTP hydrolase)